MRLQRTLTGLLCASAISLFSAGVWAQDQSTGDPVADAARKAREQKKNAPKPKIVLTDDDIAPRPAAPPSSPATASTATTGADGTAPTAVKPEIALAQDAEKKAEDPNSEQAWRKRFAAQHKKISDAQLELDVLQREAQKLDLQYYPDPQKAMTQQYSRSDINEKNEKIEKKKQEIAALQKQLNDMEDQLRAGGGDPGWAR